MDRVDPWRVADEKTMLARFLDNQRAAMLEKAAGLTDEQARWSPLPTGTSLFGLLAHLVTVERWWLTRIAAGLDAPFPWTDDDPDADWRGDEYATLADVVRGYEEECARGRAVLAAADLDALGHPPHDDRTVRWIVVHLIEETARHAGHADVIREQIDGVVGV